MHDSRLNTMKCYIIAGAPDPDINFIKNTVKSEDFVLCADRGYSYAKQAGIEPDVIIGDFDSCKDEIPQSCEVVSLEREKLYTDTIHCVDNALEKGYHNIVILSAVGGRLDHTFGNLSALDYISSRGGKGVLLSERERIELLTSGEHSFEKVDGLTFSLFAFGCKEAVISIEGVHYPLDKFTLKNCEPIGVSNIFEGSKTKITVHSGQVVIIINTDNNFL